MARVHECVRSFTLVSLLFLCLHDVRTQPMFPRNVGEFGAMTQNSHPMLASMFNLVSNVNNLVTGVLQARGAQQGSNSRRPGDTAGVNVRPTRPTVATGPGSGANAGLSVERHINRFHAGPPLSEGPIDREPSISIAQDASIVCAICRQMGNLTCIQMFCANTDMGMHITPFIDVVPPSVSLGELNHGTATGAMVNRNIEEMIKPLNTGVPSQGQGIGRVINNVNNINSINRNIAEMMTPVNNVIPSQAPVNRLAGNGVHIQNPVPRPSLAGAVQTRPIPVVDSARPLTGSVPAMVEPVDPVRSMTNVVDPAIVRQRIEAMARAGQGLQDARLEGIGQNTGLGGMGQNTGLVGTGQGQEIFVNQWGEASLVPSTSPMDRQTNVAQPNVPATNNQQLFNPDPANSWSPNVDNGFQSGVSQTFPLPDRLEPNGADVQGQNAVNIPVAQDVVGQVINELSRSSLPERPFNEIPQTDPNSNTIGQNVDISNGLIDALPPGSRDLLTNLEADPVPVILPSFVEVAPPSVVSNTDRNAGNVGEGSIANGWIDRNLPQPTESINSGNRMVPIATDVVGNPSVPMATDNMGNPLPSPVTVQEAGMTNVDPNPPNNEPPFFVLAGLFNQERSLTGTQGPGNNPTFLFNDQSISSGIEAGQQPSVENTFVTSGTTGQQPAVNQGFVSWTGQQPGVNNQGFVPGMTGGQQPGVNNQGFVPGMTGGQQPGVNNQGFVPGMTGGKQPGVNNQGFMPGMTGGQQPGVNNQGFIPGMAGGQQPGVNNQGFVPGMTGGQQPGVNNQGFVPGMTGGQQPGINNQGFVPSMAGGQQPGVNNQGFMPGMTGGQQPGVNNQGFMPGMVGGQQPGVNNQGFVPGMAGGQELPTTEAPFTISTINPVRKRQLTALSHHFLSGIGR